MDNLPEARPRQRWLHLWTLMLLFTVASWIMFFLTKPWQRVVLDATAAQRALTNNDLALRWLFWEFHRVLLLLPIAILITGLYYTITRRSWRPLALGVGLGLIQLLLALTVGAPLL
ncbi:MAG: hypothetical protein ACYC7E_18945 [Armatimonadota bacterium]